MPDGVSISLEDMYRILVGVDQKVTTLTTSATHTASIIADHEQRLRQIEAAELNERRVEQMEADMASVKKDLEAIKKRLYAIPSLASAVAVCALVITIIRWQ